MRPAHPEILARERLIFALDVSSADEARRLVEQLGDSVVFYKLGLELLMSGSFFELVLWLNARRKKIFADAKFFDVPQTVGSAVRQLTRHPISFVTVHGNDDILSAACEVKGPLKVLAVTVLTSLDQRDIEDLGFKTDLRQLASSRARRAVEIGCDGLITSGHEIESIRQAVGSGPLIVVPGIRAEQSRGTDDQKRTVTAKEAFSRGADYIVVGRPIRTAPDPRETAESIQAEISAIFY